MGAEAVLGQLDSAINKTENFSAQLMDGINGILGKVNSLLSDIPGWLQSLASWIVDKAKWLGEQLKNLGTEILDWLDKNVWPVIRGPVTLYQAGNDWTTAVYHPASTVSGDTNLARTSVDDWWQGAAATAYTQIIPVQKAASDKVAEIASKTKDTLQTLAFALAAIYVAILALLLWLLLQIPIIAGFLTSVIGIPAALVDGVATFLLVLGGAAALFGGAYALAQDALGSFGTLLQLQNDNTAFENGHWPKDATALGEIGNGTLWRYKG